MIREKEYGYLKILLDDFYESGKYAMIIYPEAEKGESALVLRNTCYWAIVKQYPDKMKVFRRDNTLIVVRTDWKW
jgi:hypothetical protein